MQQSLLLALAALAIAAASYGAPGPVAKADAPRPDQTFRLEPGDFRWVPFTVHQPPLTVDCKFTVVEGHASVHAELLPMSEFRLFDRGRPHDTMAVTPDSRGDGFRRTINTPGQYAVVIKNGNNAPPALISLHLETNSGPEPARTLTPERRLTVLLISFGVFFISAVWSSRKLIRAMRSY
jgi:hypothetical protein